MSKSPSRISLLVVVVCLLAAGALLFRSAQQLKAASERPSSAQSGEMTLHAVAAAGDVGALTRELNAGAKVDVVIAGTDVGRRGMTALMLAAQNGRADAVQLLLERGADVNRATDNGRTALMLAAGWGDLATIRAILARNPRIDARTDDGWTALMFAAARGRPEVVVELVRAGANVRERTRDGQTPLMRAAGSGDIEKVAPLLATAARDDINLVDHDGRSALRLAAEATQPGAQVVAALLEAGADANLADAEGVTPLMQAAVQGDAERVQALLNAGARVDASDALDRSVMDWARFRDDAKGKAVQDLLNARRGG